MKWTTASAVAWAIAAVPIKPAPTGPSYTLTANNDGHGTVTLTPSGGTYVSGTTVTLTPVPNSGYLFDSWSGANASDIVNTAGVYTIVMDGDKTIQANFVTAYTLTVTKSGDGSGTVTSTPAGIDCGTTCSYLFPDGASVTLNAVAATGSTFNGYAGACYNDTCTVTMTANRTVDAMFSLNRYSLNLTFAGAAGAGGTVTASPGGASCNTNCVLNFDYPTEVTLTATPALGAMFVGWGGDCSGSGTCSVTMTEVRNVTATFSFPRDLTMAVSPSGGGTTSPSVGVHTYPLDTVVSISATAAAGYHFVNWSGDVADPNSASTTVTMSAAKTVTANFALDEYTLDVISDGDGYVGRTPPQATYHYNDVVKLTATGDPGWGFHHWSGDLTGTTNPANITMTGDKVVTATFTKVWVDGAVSSGTGAPTASSVSFSHATGTDNNRLLLVGVSWNCGTTDRTISSATFTPDGGSALSLTPVITQQYTWPTNNFRYTAIYRLLNPASGVTGTLNITFSGAVSNGIIAGAANFAGVDQTTPLGTPGGAVGTGTNTTGTPNPSVTLTGLTGTELVFDSLFIGISDAAHVISADSGQSALWNVTDYPTTNFNTRGAASTKPATGASATMSWTTAGYGTTATRWAIAAVPLNPAAAPVLPGTFGKTSPAHTATGVATSGTLTWAASSGATSYEVCLSNTNALCDTFSSVGNVTSYSYSGLVNDSRYYWQVRARNADGTTLADDGAIWYFNTVAAATHTVTFNANGGTGTMSNQTANSSTALTLNAFTRDGYNFDHWNTLANNTGTSYSDGATYDFSADVTLYAQWTVIPNQAPVVSGIPDQTIAEGSSFTTVSLDDYVSDPDDSDAEMTWTFSGNSSLSVSISDRVATITAPDDWNGSETITFKATDPGALFDDDAAIFTVTAVNDAPVNDVPADQTTDEDTSLTFTTGNLVSVSDIDVSETANGKLQVNLSVSHGTMTLLQMTELTFTLGDGTNDAAMTFTATPANVNAALNGMAYQPASNYNGPDSLEITTNDQGNTGTGGVLSDTDSVSITVNPVNDDPVITEGDSTDVTMSEDGSPTAFSLTLHATDVDGDSLSWSLYSAASNGTAGASGTGASVIVSYAPDANWNGSDSFVVEVSDSGGGGLASPDKIGGSDSITVNVTVQAVNDAPVAEDQSVSTLENTPKNITVIATDVDHATLGYEIVDEPIHGNLVILGLNTWQYSPLSGYSGPDSFTFQAYDGDMAYSNEATVSITVSNVNSPPAITEGDSVSVTMAKNGVPLAFELTLNATDADGDSLTWSIQTQALNGTASVSTPDTGASMVIGYTPNNNYKGNDSFVVQVTDGTDSDSITVNVTVLDTFPVPLEPGWNLISFSFLPYDTDVETVLEDVFANFDLAYAWNASTQSWLKYDDVELSPDTLENLDQTMGVWIKMSAADTLWNVGTPQAVTNISLLDDWNLTGFPDTQSRALPGALTDHGVPLANFTLVYAYHVDDPTDPWKLYDKSAPDYANDLKNISPIWGYWIQVSTATPITWHVEY